MDLRETVSLPLPPSLRSRLLSAGFLTVADFHTLKPEDLARDASLSIEDAKHVLGVAVGSIQTSIIPTAAGIAGARSAWELLEAERSRGRVHTMSAELDQMLGGGVALQELTEICGPPGVGKTQLGMQLAINVQTPAVLGGVEGEAVYIDTEGSFMVERAAAMADAWAAHCNAAAAAIDTPAPYTTTPYQRPNQQHSQHHYQQHQSQHQHSQQHMLASALGAASAAVASRVSRAAALAGVHYLRVYDHTEQTALVHSLPHLLAVHPKVKLIVMDSVTFHFRHGFTDMGLRSRLLASMARELLAIADEHNVAVVLVNQVTTKVEGEVSRLVPALGESWAHACTNRVILFWSGGQRFAHLFKSPYLRAGTAPFTVTSEGVRSLEDAHKRQRLDGSERALLLAGPGVC
ncbi:hypothetical protein CLOM_g22035 [Closterium sp. NIES-68]|nr:hypothetical protein CLOM_g22035 [Closterium sp. NIES-68]GJP77782.1 hypothetical protein CLOP_g8127 [Closterium sp. NIES-67]